MISMNDHDDIDFEPEDELGSIGALKAKIVALKNELENVKKERSEYLDGWQRSKADMVNYKREASENIQLASVRARVALCEDIIPVLDSFDIAVGSEVWKSVDVTWRAGVEGIRAQLKGVLESQGIRSIGVRGELFDPQQHEALQEVSGGPSHTISKVIRTGYASSERVIRPAHVIIFS